MNDVGLPHLLTLAAGLVSVGIYGALAARTSRDRSGAILLMLAGCALASISFAAFLPEFRGERRIGFLVAAGLIMLGTPYLRHAFSPGNALRSEKRVSTNAVDAAEES